MALQFNPACGSDDPCLVGELCPDDEALIESEAREDALFEAYMTVDPVIMATEFVPDTLVMGLVVWADENGDCAYCGNDCVEFVGDVATLAAVRLPFGGASLL